MEKYCSVSIDMDSLYCYRQIHGLESPESSVSSQTTDPIYSLAIPRYIQLFSQRKVPVTLFVVGRDLRQPRVKSILQDTQNYRWELANHTYSHPYALTRLPADRILREIQWGEEAILEIAPKVYGFRAPGYNITPEVIHILRQRGYLYDSSAFPCPPYYLAKAAVMTAMRFAGRKSRSILGSPRVLLTPTRPFRTDGDPYRPSADSSRPTIWELPIAVTPTLRLPFIGTSISLFPEKLLHLMVKSVQKMPFVNLELHGIDILDANDTPQLKELKPYQPDLKVPWWEKKKRLEMVLQLLSETHKFVTLKEFVLLSNGEER